MHKYKKFEQLLSAIQSGEIPTNCVSPGGAAGMLGITRQSVHERMKTGSLESWTSEGYILISVRSIKAVLKKKQGIPETQGELYGSD